MIVIAGCLVNIFYSPVKLFLHPFLYLVPFDKGQEHEDPRKGVHNLRGEAIDSSIDIPFLYEGL